MEHEARRTAGSWRAALCGAILTLTAVGSAGADPTLSYSTFLGGSLDDTGQAVAAQWGYSFFAGVTRSGDYPVTGVSPDKPNNDAYTRDPFVTALDSSGGLWYSAFMESGAHHHRVLDVGAGTNGNIYVASISYGGGEGNTAITKLAPWGYHYWTYTLWGRLYLEAMAVDPEGNVYLAGRDNSDQPGSFYNDRVAVYRINADGTLGYRITIDGRSPAFAHYPDYGYDIAVDAAGNAYVTGSTLSNDLPRAIQPPPPFGLNAFVTALDPAGEILWTTYLGGSGEDIAREIEIAADGTLVVAGTTQSADLPTLNAVQTELRGAQDLFVARFRYWGSRISTTYLGGSGADEVHDMALEPASVLLAVNSPGADSPLQQPLGFSCSNSFLAKLDASVSRVLDAACLEDADILAVAADSSGISVTGSAGPGLQTVDAWDAIYNGEGDAFAARLTLNHAPDCSAATANPATLWPVGGGFVPVSVQGVTDLEGDLVTVAFTAIYQDEGLTTPSQPDATGLGTSTARLRASRLTWGNGRVYHLSFIATDARGGSCSGLIKVCVPVAQGGTCGDGGARVDSTQFY